jgi:hypothetical protein
MLGPPPTMCHPMHVWLVKVLAEQQAHATFILTKFKCCGTGHVLLLPAFSQALPRRFPHGPRRFSSPPVLLCSTCLCPGVDACDQYVGPPNFVNISFLVLAHIVRIFALDTSRAVPATVAVKAPPPFVNNDIVALGFGVPSSFRLPPRHSLTDIT